MNLVRAEAARSSSTATVHSSGNPDVKNDAWCYYLCRSLYSVLSTRNLPMLNPVARLCLLPVVFILHLTTTIGQVDMDVLVYESSVKNPVSGIYVTLTNTSIGYKFTSVSDNQGKTVFRGLPLSGSYELSVAESDSFYASVLPGIMLFSQTSASVTLPVFRKKDLTLPEFTVGGASRVNARNAEVSSVLRQEELAQLPVEGRDVTRALYRLPNIVQATGFYPEAPNVGINGANSLYTNYMIDGMDNNEQFLGGMKFNIPVGFVRDIRALTNNFSAEYGQTGNGVINISSRSGSNEYSAEAFLVTRPGAITDSPSPYAQRDLSGNQVKDGFRREQIGFGAGGPIRKDKTFYYLNAEFTRDLKDNLLASPALGVNETVPGQNNFNYLSARLDHRWNKKLQTAFRANLGLVNIARQGGGLDGGIIFPSAASFQDRNSALFSVRNTFLGDAFKSETNFQYSRFRWNYGRAANPGSPNVTVLDPGGIPAALLGHPGYLFDAVENTLQFQQKLSWYFDKHVLKAGAEIMSADHSLFGGGNPNGSYLVQLTQAQQQEVLQRARGAGLDVQDIPSDVQVIAYSVELRPASFGARHNMYATYLEDVWSVNSRLTLNIGVRYDLDNLSKGGGTRYDLNNVAPRLSFNYRLNQRSSLRGGFGLYYDKILYAVYSDALQQNTTDSDYKRQITALVSAGILPADTSPDRVTFDGNLSATATQVAYLQGPSYTELQGQRAGVFSGERRILNPSGYQNPVTQQIALGYQFQPDKDKLFYVDLVHNNSRYQYRLRDLNAPSAWINDDPQNVKIRTQAEADLTRPVAIYPGGYTLLGGDTVRGVARNVVMTETAGQSRYTALSVNFEKNRSDDRYAYRLTYTLSRLENNTEDINFRAMDANDFDKEWAPGINDRTHVINSYFTFFPSKRWSLTLATLLQSGQPVNRIPDAVVYGTTDLNGDGRSFGDAYVGNSDRQPGETRNNDRLPWSSVFDFSGACTLLKSESNVLVLRADIFNLFNAVNLSGYSNNATQSNQIQSGPVSSGVLVRRNAGAPRQFQFSLHLSF